MTDVYYAIRGGVPVDAFMWDGVAEFTHPDADTVVLAADWQGAPYVGAPEPTEVQAQRNLEDTLRSLRAQATDDLATVDTATVGQLRPIVRRLLRAERVLIRLQLADLTAPADDAP